MKDELREYFQNDNIILLDRAFLGLYSIYKIIKEKTKKSKILFTSTTCPSPVFAATYAGLETQFVDINLDNFLMDFDQTEQIIKNDSDIAAIVYIYTFGHSSSDVLKIRDLAHEKGIFLIEDVAQALGSEIDGKLSGTIGDISVFSFGYSKQVEVGVGGALLVNNTFAFSINEIKETILNIKRYDPNSELANEYSQEFYDIRKKALSNPNLYSQYISFPNKYKKLYFKKISVDWEDARRIFNEYIKQKVIEKRNEKANQYFEILSQKPYSDQLILPKIEHNPSIYRYTFLLKNSNYAQEISTLLRQSNINCSNLYIPVSRIYSQEGFNNSVYFAERVINLWVDKQVTRNYIEDTIKVFDNFFDSKK